MPFLVFKDGQQFGPFELDELTRHVREGGILLTDHCWQEGWDEWYPVHSIVALPAPALAPASTPLPLPQPSPQASSPSAAASPRVSRRTLFIAGGAALAVLILCYFASPYWTLYRLKRAVDRNDAVFVADRVDFPRFRESVKGALTANLATEAATADSEGFEALGAAFGAMMVGPMVDAFVTPEGLVQMMQGRDMGSILEDDAALSEADPSQSFAEVAETNDREGGMEAASMGYETLNRFAVAVEGGGDGSQMGGEGFTLLFSRRGLTGWILSGIRIGQN